MTKEEFALRLAKLRQARSVSARDMSLSMGQSPSYISSIENGSAFPSMTGFFYICDYLHVTLGEFFAEDVWRSRRGCRTLWTPPGTSTGIN